MLISIRGLYFRLDVCFYLLTVTNKLIENARPVEPSVPTTVAFPDSAVPPPEPPLPPEFDEELPPPPQPNDVTRKANAIAASAVLQPRRRLPPPRKKVASIASTAIKPANVHKGANPCVRPVGTLHVVGINIALAVVFTVSVTVALVVPGESETEVGLNEQVAPDGSPEQVRLIVPV
jgi:hypothetical protein